MSKRKKSLKLRADLMNDRVRFRGDKRDVKISGNLIHYKTVYFKIDKKLSLTKCMKYLKF